MFVAIFAKEFGTGVSRAKKWNVWCSGGEPVNSCYQKDTWLLWKPLKIERKGKIVLICRCKEVAAGREERLCVYGSQECSVVLPLIHADSGSLFSAPFEWLCYSNFGIEGLRLTRKGICIYFHSFSWNEEVQYLLWDYLEFWRLGKLISFLAAACWSSAPLGNKDLDFLWGFIWKRGCKRKV